MKEPTRIPDKVLCAYIAVGIAPGLSGNARRVAAALFNHWNRKTAQCDPSVERLATMLAVDRATVLRATAELCTGDARLFDKKSHGGKGNRASYAPRWETLRAIVVDWNERMPTGAAPEKVAKMRRSRSQDCDVEGRKTATQTYRRNLSKEPTPVEKTAERHRKPTRRGPVGQGWLLLPLPGGNVSHEQAATTAAQRRIMKSIRESGDEVFMRVCEIATPAMLTDAATEEMQVQGSGARALLVAVNNEIEMRRVG